ncbi:MAG: RNA polymerase-associated protein RapA [Pseudomonadota bacterium]
MDFVLGQRWVSQTETDLGLGIVVGVEGRHVTVRFPAVEEDRVYAVTNSPLARVIYQIGDTLTDAAGDEWTVSQVESVDGLLCYLVDDETTADRVLPETQISGFVNLSSPTQRLFSGQVDNAQEFALRVQALTHQGLLDERGLRGLVGGRVSLLAHQMYIASEVARRHAPRVLLADEVGLGKTVEAGLIAHNQIQTGLASRVLIVVPDALLHQWLVEMLRKFGLHFALFDVERIQALVEDGEVSPFESEQHILCGLSTLADDVEVLAQALAAPWDLLIVDEAHHLRWEAEAPSVEYRVIEQLAQQIPGVLLLTATPEQLGQASHFARLRLLDPSRFSSLDKFIAEQDRFASLSDVAEELLADRALSASSLAALDELLGPGHGERPADKLVAELLDRHGTGRVLFRNTRGNVDGFPRRNMYVYALKPGDDHPGGLYPECAAGGDADWVRRDPRVAWLEAFYREHRGEKILLICHAAKTALDLEHHLHLNVGIRSAAFYEGLSIIERDRAAAYFADTDGGAQTLICSEIGSEGRNFQFAHHLVLFDLPLNPDLLEQRIGRLDRIGQQQEVDIHVPYVEGTAQEVLWRWYHEGMDAFRNSFSAGYMVYQHFADRLQRVLDAPGEDYVELLRDTAQRVAQMRDDLAAGRDRLLERNSCDPVVAGELIDAVRAIDADPALRDFLLEAFDVLGVDYEDHTEESLVLRPSEHMALMLPTLSDDGITVTFDREVAMVREDMEFLSWEAPLVSGLLEVLLGSELGNTNLATIKLKALPPGTILLEAFYTLKAIAPAKYQMGRFLRPTPTRVLLETSGRDLSGVINHAQLNGLCSKVRKSARMAIVKEVRGQVETLLTRAQTLAADAASAQRATALQRVEELVGSEEVRLEALQKVNANIRDTEIEFFRTQQAQVRQHIEHAQMELDAVRLIIAV